MFANACRGPSGFGFVTFADPRKCDDVVASGPHTLDDRQIDPKPAVPRGGGGDPRGVAPGSGTGGSSSSAGHSHAYGHAAGSGSPYGARGPAPSSAGATGLAMTPGQTRKIFAGGLTPETTEASLREYFSQHGLVDDVIIMTDHTTGRPRGFGFVTFASEDVVDKLCAQHFVEIAGKQVEVKPAMPRNPGDGGFRGGHGGYRGGSAGGFRGGSAGGGRSGGYYGAYPGQAYGGGDYGMGGYSGRADGGYSGAPSSYGAGYGAGYGTRGGYGARGGLVFFWFFCFFGFFLSPFFFTPFFLRPLFAS